MTLAKTRKSRKPKKNPVARLFFWPAMAAIVLIVLSALSGNDTLIRGLAPPLILALSCLLLVWVYYEFHTGTLHLPALNLSRPGRLHTADRNREPILFYFWLTMYVAFGVVMVLIFGAIVFFGDQF